LGQDSASTVALGNAINFDRTPFHYKLPYLLQARFCQQSGDYECALDNWKKVQGIDANNLQALVNTALIHTYKNNNVDIKNNALADASKMSKNYIPLQELSELSESKNVDE